MTDISLEALSSAQLVYNSFEAVAKMNQATKAPASKE